MNVESGSAVVSSVFLNEFLMNSSNSASEPASTTRRHWPFGYVPNEPFAIKRTDDRDDSLEWAADNLKRLVSEYPDKWIVVKNRNVVETSDDLVGLLKKASRAGIANPLVLKMDQLPRRKWRTVF